MSIKHTIATLLLIVSIVLVIASFMMKSKLIETMFESISLCGALFSFHLFSMHTTEGNKKI